MKKTLILGLILLLAVSGLSATTYYVDTDATGSNDGSTWTNAYTDLQSAISASSSGDEIWVAAGTYKPTTESSRTTYFRMVNGVGVYGGFAGTESATSQRSDYGVGGTNETILSGDIGVVDDNSDNSYHVIYLYDVGSLTVIDGFTITKGNSNGYSYNYTNKGGGICNRSYTISSPTISNCNFTSNNASYGGGMYNETIIDNAIANLTIINCNFTNNTAALGGALCETSIYKHGITMSSNITNCTFSNNEASNGGAVDYYFSRNVDGSEMTISPNYDNCQFVNNTSQSSHGKGGAVRIELSSSASSSLITCEPTFTSCVFSGNSLPNENQGTYYGGGAMYLGASGHGSGLGTKIDATIEDCTFSNNTAGSDGGAIYAWANTYTTCDLDIDDCVFTNNTATNGDGGAIAYQGITGNNQMYAYIDRSTFQGNQCLDNGSAIFIQEDGTTYVKLTNCLITGNKSTYAGTSEKGSTIYSSGDYTSDLPELDIINCTISGNDGYYTGGIFYKYGNNTNDILNTIMYNNNSRKHAAFANAYKSNYASYPTVSYSNCSIHNYQFNPPSGNGKPSDIL